MTPAPERPDPIYCTGGCDACRDYARELGVPLIVSAAPVPDAGLREAARDVLEEYRRADECYGSALENAIDRLRAALSRQAEKETA